MYEALVSAKQHRLTRKQEAFVSWYTSAEVNMAGTEAARRAGYKGSVNTLASVATENLRKPAIRKEIDRRLNVATAGAAVTVERVLIQLQATYAMAFEAGKYSAAVRCLELQGKYLKMFSDRIEHIQSIEDCSTEELVVLLREVVANGGIDLEALFSGSN
jgi:phage terminase small subunit